MTQSSTWKKLSLVFVVCFGHLVLLAGFSSSFAPGEHAGSTGKSIENIAVTLRRGANHPAAHTAAKPHEVPSKLDKQVPPEASHGSGLPNRDYFLDTAEVDQPAEPSGDFEVWLAQLLPPNIEPLVLEFWIDKDGRTVEVKCIEGVCSDDVLASLPKLATLAFAPAVKNAEAVANRKVIQIDVKPGFGL